MAEIKARGLILSTRAGNRSCKSDGNISGHSSAKSSYTKKIKKLIKGHEKLLMAIGKM